MNEQPTGKKVWLLVEDDPTLRRLITIFMRDLWHAEPLVFNDGFQTMRWLDQVEQHADSPLPEVALLDHRIPGPGGPEIAHRMRDIEPTQDIPIVLLTAAHMDKRERVEVEHMADLDRTLAKPLPAPEEMKAILDEVIAQRKKRAELELD